MLRLNEAIARAQSNSENKKMLEYKRELAALLWPESKERTQHTNMQNLVNGKTKAISPFWVIIICKTLNCTPNYLFGFNEENKNDE